MNERELGEELLSYDAAQIAKTDPVRLAAGIIHRDQRLTRFWSASTIILWLVTAGFLFPIIAEMRKMTAEISVTMQKLIDATKIESDLPDVLNKTAAMGVRLSMIAIGAMVLATVLTVLLVRSSRRATLRQVNANLLQIARQIEGLKSQ
jgi:hypothetical protein